MLPSFRLIAVTFLCGFIVVFAGLRLANSLNDIHEGLPVMAADAAPVAIAEAADREPRRGPAAAPTIYDWRFAIRTASQTSAAAPPVSMTALLMDRAAPLVVHLPLPIAPEEMASTPAEPADTVAALGPEPVAAAEPAPETPKADAPLIAAVDTAAPAGEAETPREAAPAPAAVQAAADLSPVGSVPAAEPPEMPVAGSAANSQTAKPAPRAAVHKKRVRVARAAARPRSSFAATDPFTSPTE